MDNSWVGAPNDVRHGAEAVKALATKNDFQYWSATDGVTKVSLERWREAQRFECDGWLKHWSHAASDRHEEHFNGFNGYYVVPKHLRSVIEIGCGPFTQLSTILRNRTATSITLVDPLLEQYRQLPHCPYATGQYLGYTPTLRACMAEDVKDVEAFDVVICINVLEHVMDATVVLDNLYNMLKPRGVLVFGERWHDSYDPRENFDIGHPIIVRKSILDAFKRRFYDIYDRNEYFVGIKYASTRNQ